MLRLGLPAVVVVALAILWMYCILDVIASDAVLVRNLPKMVWLMIVVFIPDIGSVAWLALGRPAYAGWRPGDTEPRAAGAGRPYARGPEDDSRFISPAHPSAGSAALQAWEDDLARRERELRKRPDAGTDDDATEGGSPR